MPGTADRQEFCQPLYHSHNDCFPYCHKTSSFPFFPFLFTASHPHAENKTEDKFSRFFIITNLLPSCKGKIIFHQRKTVGRNDCFSRLFFIALTQIALLIISAYILFPIAPDSVLAPPAYKKYILQFHNRTNFVQTYHTVPSAALR